LSSTQFSGVLAATVTPFTADGSAIDEPAVVRLADHMIAGGVKGFVACGSTGEFTTQTPAERKRNIELHIEAASGRVPVVAGTAALSTRETVDLSMHAEQVGAAAVMIAPPFYEAPSFDEVLAHFIAVSEAIEIPVMYYNMPALTGVHITPEQLAELARRTNITSYKDSGGDFPWLTSVHLDHGDAIQVLNGYDTLTFSAFSLGAVAGVWGAASLIPKQCSDLYEAVVVSKDLDAGRELWSKIFPLCRFLESHSYSAAVKAGLELVGVPAGPTRLPVQPLAEEYRKELRELLVALGASVAAEPAGTVR
jgi:4-hydroxy-tetrahydrodipicolinate synthase